MAFGVLSSVLVGLCSLGSVTWAAVWHYLRREGGLSSTTVLPPAPAMTSIAIPYDLYQSVSIHTYHFPTDKQLVIAMVPRPDGVSLTVEFVPGAIVAPVTVLYEQFK